MSIVGVLIETGDNGVKSANFGVITAARDRGNNEVYALVTDGNAAVCKAAVDPYGVAKVVELRMADADLTGSPDLHAIAVAEAVQTNGMEVLMGLSSIKGRDLLARA